jgi:hypothetical protein
MFKKKLKEFTTFTSNYNSSVISNIESGVQRFTDANSGNGLRVNHEMSYTNPLSYFSQMERNSSRFFGSNIKKQSNLFKKTTKDDNSNDSGLVGFEQSSSMFVLSAQNHTKGNFANFEMGKSSSTIKSGKMKSLIFF